MTYRSGLLSGFLISGLVAAVAAGVWWVVTPGTPPTKPTPLPAPASVPKVLKEDQVNALTLTPEAVRRLGLETAPLQRKPMRGTRVYGGEVTIPPGNTVVVAAPLTGTLRCPGGTLPQAGRAVAKGQVIFQLYPLLTPEGRANLASARIDADGQVKTAQSQLEAAQIALTRARRVFQSEAGSRRAVDEAQAQFDLAEKAVAAAAARRELLEKVLGDAEKGTTAPVPVECPAGGVLRNVSALSGQNVPAGASLFEVVDLSRAWVRVPVYVGDLAEVDAAADAAVSELSARPGASSLPGHPAGAPPSANAAAGTVDLFYEIDNGSARLSPGQRVGVALALKGEAESLTCPWAAVLHDVHGGTWVYEQTGDRAFVRRRVVVRYVVGDTAVLASGPAPGTRVVTAGSAELFGTETGFSK
jgi:cobalt-zinc-cadmium efflux system membrane fusion protein